MERTANGTKLHWKRTYTGLSEGGNKNIGGFTLEREIGCKLEHFQKTGAKL